MCLGGSVVERALGKGEVAGSVPARGFSFKIFCSSNIENFANLVTKVNIKNWLQQNVENIDKY